MERQGGHAWAVEGDLDPRAARELDRRDRVDRLLQALARDA